MADNTFEVAFSIGAHITSRFNQAFNRANDAIARLTRHQEALERATKDLARAQKLQATSTGLMGDSAGKLARNMAGAAAIIAPTAKAAIDFESAMADVKKVVNFESPKEMQEYGEAIKKMSLEIPIAADGLAAIMAAAGQSGIAKKDLLEFTEQAAKMGVAFDITAEEAGTMMAKWKSGMNLPLEATFKLADATNQLSNNNAANAAQIGDVLMRYGGLGKLAGLAETEIAALAATVISAGAESEVAATGIAALMRGLQKGEFMTAGNQELFKTVGLDPAKLQKDVKEKGAVAIVGALEQIQKVVKPEAMTATLSQMFGEEAARAVGPMMSNMDLLKQNLELVGKETNYTGSMLDEFKARSATTANSLELAKNAAKYAAMAFGDQLLPTIRELSAKFVEVAEKAGKWIAENKETVKTGLKVAGVLLGINTAIHAVTFAVGAVIYPFARLWTAIIRVKQAFLVLKGAFFAIRTWGPLVAILGKLKIAFMAVGGALKALGLAIAANPIVLAIGAAVAALVAAVYWSKELSQGWEWLKGKALALWSTFAEKFPMLSGYLQAFFGPTIVAVRTIIDVFMELINFIRNIFTRQWEAAWQNVKNIGVSIFEGMKDLIRVPLNGIIRMINSALSFSVPDWVPGIGGKSFSVDIPMLANGGVVTRATPAIVGEGSEPEAVLPLSKLDGMLSGAGKGGGGAMAVTFSPVINVSGGSDAYSQVKRGLDEGLASLKRELERIQRNERRLAY